MGEFSAVVLRNKGVPVELYRLEPDGSPMVDANDEPVTEKVYLRFTAGTIADVERRWSGFTTNSTEVIDGVVQTVTTVHDGVAGYHAAQAVQPIATTIDVMALMLGREPKEVGNAMVPAKSVEYIQATTAAWQIANGMDPEQAGKALEAGRELHEQAQEKQGEQLLALMEEQMKALAQIGTPGTDGSESGSDPSASEGSVEASTSSGSSPQRRSPSISKRSAQTTVTSPQASPEAT